MAFKRARTDDQVDIRLKTIRKAAAALFDREGVEGVTFAQVAAKTGLTRPALYSYYSNRHDLILDLLTEEFNALNRSLDLRLNSLSADEAKAEILSKTLAEELAAHRRFTGLLLQNCSTFAGKASEKMVRQFNKCILLFSKILASSLQRLNNEIGCADALKYASAVYSALIGTYASCGGENTILCAYSVKKNAATRPVYEEELSFVLNLLTTGVFMKSSRRPTIKQAFSRVLNLDPFL